MKARQNGAVLLVLISAVLGQSPLAAQCTRRILVYIDASKSMTTRVGGAQTPYELSRRTLKLLFDSNFTVATDRVEVYSFDKKVYQMAMDANGVRNLPEFPETLEPNDTDLAAVFLHIRGRLATEGFERQVVLVASDFDHDPTNGMKPAKSQADWAGRAEPVLAALKSRFSEDRDAVLLLFKAPLTKRGILAERQAAVERREYVLGSIRKTIVGSAVALPGDDSSLVETDIAGSVDPAVLTAAIGKSLVRRPLSSVKLKQAEGQRKLVATVMNRHCATIRPSAILASCSPGNPPSPQFGLGASISPGGQQDFWSSPVPDDCWNNPQATLSAVATLENGVQSIPESRPGGNWLDVATVTARLDTKPTESQLQLDLWLRGLMQKPEIYRIRVTTKSGANIMEREFATPADMKDGLYRILARAHGPTRSVEDHSEVQVTIQRVEGGEKEVTRLAKTDTKSEMLLWWLQVLVPVVAILVAYITRVPGVSIWRDVFRYSSFFQTLPPILSSVGSIGMIFRSIWLSDLAKSTVDGQFLQAVLTCLFLGIVAHFFARRLRIRRLREDVFENRLDTSAYGAALKRRFLWHWGIPAATFAVAFGFCAAFQQLTYNDSSARILELVR